MIDHILTNQELGLLIELLESENRRLLLEIRHTDARTLRSELVERARTVERIIERFKLKQEELQPSGSAHQ